MEEAATRQGGDDPIIAIIKSKKNPSHAGPLGQLKSIEPDLLCAIFEHQEQGSMKVDYFIIVVKASTLSSAFNAKSFTARCSAVKRVLRAHLFVYRMGTHKSQRKPEEFQEEATDYMRLISPFLIGNYCDPRFILNMDQTPVYFLMNAKRTLELIGKKTIHIRTSTNNTKRVAVTVTIAGDGTVLPSVVVFKGKANGHIAKKEFATFPTSHHYHCQFRMPHGWTRQLCWHGLTRSCGRMSRRLLKTSSLSSSSTATDAT